MKHQRLDINPLALVELPRVLILRAEQTRTAVDILLGVHVMRRFVALHVNLFLVTKS